MKKSVGLFRVLTFEDLDLVARLLSKYDPKDVYDILDEKLINKAKGNEGRRKLINNLMMVWGNGKKEPLRYQKKAMISYMNMENGEQKVMHYLMMLIEFPFLAFESKLAGKYLRLQDILTSKTFNDEVINEYGSSGTIKRSVSNGFGILVEFGFLTKKKSGLYKFEGNKIKVNSIIIKNYIILAVLTNSENEVLSLEQINNDSMMYGLDYNIVLKEVNSELFNISNERIDIYIGIK